jgi:hypothetical protein
VLASLHGSLGLSVLGRAESGVAIFESFWARHDAAHRMAGGEHHGPFGPKNKTRYGPQLDSWRPKKPKIFSQPSMVCPGRYIGAW